VFDWLKRRPASRVTLGLATGAAEAESVREVAEGLGQGDRPEIRDDVDALTAHPAFAACPLILIATAEGRAPDIAARVASARGGGPSAQSCEIAVLAEDPLTQIALRDADATLTGLPIRIRPLSRTAFLARQLLAETCPPDRVLRLAPDGGHLPVIIAGDASHLAAQILLALLRLLHLPGIAPMATLAGPGMPGLLARLRGGLPELDAIGRIVASERMAHDGPLPALILALPGAPDDEALRRVDASGVAPIVRLAAPGWREIAARLRDDEQDRVARSIHALHLAERVDAGRDRGEHPSLVPWDELPERFREASRHQASHTKLKLRVAGARGMPPTETASFAWTEAELAALARVEHARWASVVRSEGWSLGATRDDRAKRTPLLVPFDDLTQEIRDIDVLPVRAAPRQLNHAGLAATRDLILAVRAGTAPPGRGFAAGLRAALDRVRKAHGERQLVLRIAGLAGCAGTAAELAARNGIAFQLALTTEPQGELPAPLLRAAERIAVGSAVSMLPAAIATIGLGDVPPSSADLFHLDADGRPVAQ
jgi:hypothetical protein